MIARSYIFAVAAAAAALSSTLVAVSPAIAQQIEGVEVRYRDLNLTSEAGRTVLDNRIRYAARQLCGQYGATELRWLAMSRACQADVIESAQAQRNAVVGGQRYASLVVSRAAL